jgi:hypothetical protein
MPKTYDTSRVPFLNFFPMSVPDDVDVTSLPQQKQEQFQEFRCNSLGRGSIYDSTAGNLTKYTKP